MKLIGTKLADLETGPIRGYALSLFAAEGMDPTEDFQFNLGGDFYMVETLADLKSISSNGETSLFDGAIDLDVAELLTPELCMICIITNNSGGNTYFINKPQFTQSLLDSLYKFSQGKQNDRIA